MTKNKQSSIRKREAIEFYKVSRDLKKGDLVKLRLEEPKQVLGLVKSNPHFGSFPEWLKNNLRLINASAPIPNKLWLVSVQPVSGTKENDAFEFFEKPVPTDYWEKVNVS